MILALLAQPALALSASTLTSFSAVTICGTSNCPKAALNPVVSQPNGEIEPNPFSDYGDWFVGNVYPEPVGGLRTSFTLAGKTVEGYLLGKLQDDGTIDPAEFLGFGSTSTDWNGDGAADTVLGYVSWEDRGQAQVVLAFADGVSSSFAPTHEISFTATLSPSGGATAPLAVWNVESFGVWDMEGNEVFQATPGLASVALEMPEFRYASTLSVSGRTTYVAESVAWTGDGDAIVAASKGSLTASASGAGLTLTRSFAGDLETESWTADATTTSFRRSITQTSASCGAVSSVSAQDVGSRRRVSSEVTSLVDGVASVVNALSTAESLTFSPLPAASFDAGAWTRVETALTPD